MLLIGILVLAKLHLNCLWKQNGKTSLKHYYNNIPKEISMKTLSLTAWFWLTLAGYLAIAGGTGLAFAEETHIMIRARAVDAKFIGSGVGGMRAVVEDPKTGVILDEGEIRGSTGDTTLLMRTPPERGQQIATEATAGYLATVNIERPRLLRFRIWGPLGAHQSQQEAAVTSWVIPGRDIIGDGIIINLPGFIVDAWTHVSRDNQVHIHAKITMMCGCPIMKDGLWPPDRLEVKAILTQNGEKLREITLPFAGPANLFQGKTSIKEPGIYEIIVYSYDKTTGNTGANQTMVQIASE